MLRENPQACYNDIIFNEVFCYFDVWNQSDEAMRSMGAGYIIKLS